MSLRNEIKETLKTHLPIGKVIASNEGLDEPLTKIVNLQANKVLDQATSQILSLLEGSLPKPLTKKEVAVPGDIDAHEKSLLLRQGWNACLREIRSKLE